MNQIEAISEDIHAFTDRYIHDCSGEGHPYNLPKEDQDQMAYILGAALDAVREQSKLESRWSPAQLFGTEKHLAHFVETEMEKTGARCRLIIYAGSVTVEFTLPHLNELPSMDNKFWSKLAAIIDHHKIKYVNNEVHEAASASEANKSISKFVRAPMFAFLTEFHIAYQHDPKGQIRVGNFEKSIFFPESSWADVVATFTDIFCDFTRLSQSLYRSHYIKASNDPKRRLSVADFESVRAIYSWISVQSEAWTPSEVSTAFPKATKIDIQAAHDLALERGIVSGIGEPFRCFVHTGKRQ